MARMTKNDMNKAAQGLFQQYRRHLDRCQVNDCTPLALPSFAFLGIEFSSIISEAMGTERATAWTIRTNLDTMKIRKLEIIDAVLVEMRERLDCGNGDLYVWAANKRAARRLAHGVA